MIKGFFVASLLLISTSAWALECTQPVTISDPRFDGYDPSVVANETGEAAVIWISEEGHNEALAVSSKTDGGFWGSPQMISDWERNIWKKRCLVNSQGDFFAVWKAKREDGAVIQIAKKKQGESWTFPFDWKASISSFDFEEIGIGSGDKLTFVGKLRETYKEKSTYSDYTWDKTAYSLAIAGASFSQTGQNWNLLRQENDVYSLSCFGIVGNKNGLSYIFWKPYKSGSEKLLCQKMENNQLVGTSEVVCSSSGYSVKGSMNERGEIVVTSGNTVMTKVDDVWSDITPLEFKGDDRGYSTSVSIDDGGNIMLVYSVDYECRPLDDRYCFVKALYKPAGEEWMASTVFSSAKVDNEDPEVQSDGKGNFVVVWNQSQRNKNSVVGSAFSTENRSWSKPQMLSPSGVHCYDFSLTFFAPGKGYISWVALENGFDRSIQVAELSN